MTADVISTPYDIGDYIEKNASILQIDNKKINGHTKKSKQDLLTLKLALRLKKTTKHTR